VAETDKKSGFNYPAVVLLGAAALVFLWALVLFLQGGFQAAEAREYAAKTFDPPNIEVENYLAEQRAILEEEPHWTDEERTTVVIPIEDAKARIVEKNAGR